MRSPGSRRECKLGLGARDCSIVRDEFNIWLFGTFIYESAVTKFCTVKLPITLLRVFGYG